MDERRSGTERRMNEDSDRLNRIEEKLDKVGEAIVSLARMEERMITLFKRMETYDSQVAGVSTRLSQIEVALANMTGSHKWVDRVVVVLITGALSAAVFAMK